MLGRSLPVPATPGACVKSYREEKKQSKSKLTKTAGVCCVALKNDVNGNH